MAKAMMKVQMKAMKVMKKKAAMTLPKVTRTNAVEDLGLMMDDDELEYVRSQRAAAAEKAAMKAMNMMKKKAAMKPMKVMKKKAAMQPMKVLKMKCGPGPRRELGSSIIDDLNETMMWAWVNAEVAKAGTAFTKLRKVDQGFFVQALVDMYDEGHKGDEEDGSHAP